MFKPGDEIVCIDATRAFGSGADPCAEVVLKPGLVYTVWESYVGPSGVIDGRYLTIFQAKGEYRNYWLQSARFRRATPEEIDV